MTLSKNSQNKSNESKPDETLSDHQRTAAQQGRNIAYQINDAFMHGFRGALIWNSPNFFKEIGTEMKIPAYSQFADASVVNEFKAIGGTSEPRQIEGYKP